MCPSLSAPPGTPEQEDFFEELWVDFWLSQAVPGSVNARRKPRRWKQGMALFAAQNRTRELELLRRLVEKPIL